MAPIVAVEHIYKSYKSATPFEINRMFQWIGRRLRNAAAPRLPNHTGREYVLKDVSFTLERNESLGLIGNNGAGKTTLFRILSAITLPTRGRVRIEGRVSSLIALGAGFHPDLSGRENLYLNCALMGMSRTQTAGRIDQIVDFAELDEYIDVPIKYYSSGMLARLGFSVAVHLDPELILVDEVLAVGDYRFQVKSMAALRDFIERGTVILISHDLGAVERICNRAMWLEQGEIKMDGPSKKVLPYYLQTQEQAMGDQFIKDQEKGSDAPVFHAVRQQIDHTIDILDVDIRNANGAISANFQIGEEIVATVHLQFKKPQRDILIAVGLLEIDYQIIITSCDNQLIDHPDELYGHLRLECRFPNLILRPRRYGLCIVVSNQKALMPLYVYRELDTRFVVTGDFRDPALHYQAPQGDIVFTPGVQMRVIEYSTQLASDSV